MRRQIRKLDVLKQLVELHIDGLAALVMNSPVLILPSLRHVERGEAAGVLTLVVFPSEGLLEERLRRLPHGSLLAHLGLVAPLAALRAAPLSLEARHGPPEFSF